MRQIGICGGFWQKLGMTAALVVFATFAATRAWASPIHYSFTGAFNRDDNVQLFNFSVSSLSTVTLRSYSYAGGVNAAGDVIAAGGFDPILSLFDGSGDFLEKNDDGGSVPEDPATSNAFDVNLSLELSPGSYTVALSQYDNFASGSNLSDGFDRDGQRNFTNDLSSCGQPGSSFLDVDCNQRDSHWAFDILNVDAASTPPTGVPEPSGVLLLIAGLVALVFLRYRNDRARPRV